MKTICRFFSHEFLEDIEKIDFSKDDLEPLVKFGPYKWFWVGDMKSFADYLFKDWKS